MHAGVTARRCQPPITRARAFAGGASCLFFLFAKAQVGRHKSKVELVKLVRRNFGIFRIQQGKEQVDSIAIGRARCNGVPCARSCASACRQQLYSLCEPDLPLPSPPAGIRGHPPAGRLHAARSRSKKLAAHVRLIDGTRTRAGDVCNRCECDVSLYTSTASLRFKSLMIRADSQGRKGTQFQLQR